MKTPIEMVRGYLDEALDVPVHVCVPEETPDRFVVIDPVGGSFDPPFVKPQYSIQAWALTYAEAEETLIVACEALQDIPVSAGFDAMPSGAAPVPFDTYDGRHFRWQVIYQVNMMM